MNITFLIGNGFDLNIGMKTGYRHFYEYYHNIKNDDSRIINLKKEIENERNQTWADLEKALGEYTSNLDDPKDFIEIYTDIKDCLAEYIKSQEEIYDISSSLKEELFKYLAYPENVLTPSDKRVIDKFKTRPTNRNVNIITLNYTRTIENLLGYQNGELELSRHVYNAQTYATRLKKIEHLHGFTNGGMILGVDSESQILNSNFRINLRIQNAFIKSNCNKVQKHLRDESCINILNNSNLICLHGTSLGDTDGIWWKRIGDQLKNNNDCMLLIFYFDKDKIIKPNHEFQLVEYEEEICDLFLSKTKLTIEEQGKIRNRIIIGINTDIFKSIQVSKKPNINSLQNDKHKSTIPLRTSKKQYLDEANWADIPNGVTNSAQ